MSWTSDIILAYGMEEEDEPRDPSTIDLINAWLPTVQDDEDEKLHRVPEDFSNGRIGNSCLCIGSFNYLEFDLFLTFLGGLEWGNREKVQVFLKDMEDDLFRCFSLPSMRRAHLAMLPTTSDSVRQFSHVGSAGLVFVFTGTLSSMTRDDAAVAVREAGSVVASSLNESVSYLVVGDKPGTKLQQAQARRIPILSEAEFLVLLNPEELD